MSSPNPDDKDFTVESASPTDIAPLGRDSKPAHELTASEDADPVDWNAIAADRDFKKLLASKARFIVPATIFFVIYYFSLPVLVGWFPRLMEREVFGRVNVAYAFAFSQFIMAWTLAALYVAAAAGWDRQAAAVLAKFNRK
jgi:uncharacterized membrane protein (DUF485 family)